MKLLPENLLPGVSVKLGVTQGSHRPYARVGGRLGIFSAGKNLDLTEGPGILLAGAVALFALGKMNQEKTTKAKVTKKKKQLDWLQKITSPVNPEAVSKAKDFAKF